VLSNFGMGVLFRLLLGIIFSFLLVRKELVTHVELMLRT
jgi:hypothetical protein